MQNRAFPSAGAFELCIRSFREWSQIIHCGVLEDQHLALGLGMRMKQRQHPQWIDPARRHHCSIPTAVNLEHFSRLDIPFDAFAQWSIPWHDTNVIPDLRGVFAESIYSTAFSHAGAQFCHLWTYKICSNCALADRMIFMLLQLDLWMEQLQ